MKINITVTLEKAREWYNSDNSVLKEIALQAFDEKELVSNFRDIKTFQDACEALRLTYGSMLSIINQLKPVSRASAAMFKLNIIRKALNLGQDLHLTKDQLNSAVFYPCNPFIIKDSTFYDNEFKLGTMEVIGTIENEGILYNVTGGLARCSNYYGVGEYNSFYGMTGTASADFGFLGCANKEIAQHFGRYFGMLITEAKYSDLPGFQIVNSKQVE